MTPFPAAILLLATLTGPAIAKTGIADVQRSHIRANAPAPVVFKALLDRDLLSYFRTEVSGSIVSVQSSMLRDGPTQSGLSYPKYYVWVQLTRKNGKTTSGAVRVAAIDRKHFEVTDFAPAQTIRQHAEAVLSSFPVALRQAIIDRAASP